MSDIAIEILEGPVHSGRASDRFSGAREPALSVIIPAYNEALRIGPYLESVRQHLDAELPGTYEVIVVDDGSKDETASLVEHLAGQWGELRLIRHERNQGKGAAVRTGVLASSGRTILFTDADGATPIAEERRLFGALAAGVPVAIGSRYVPDPDVIRERNARRELASTVFRWSGRLLIGIGVKDTQCGFKMLAGEPGRALFENVREAGYLFDIEMLALAKRQGFRVAEVGVNWSEKAGSKVRFFRDSARMFAGLWRLRRRLRVGTARRAVPMPVPAAK